MADGPVNGNGVEASLAGLSWLNFLTALMQTAFGGFLAVYLATNGWSGTEIGFALSAGAVAALVGQVPAGLLVDWAPGKRAVAAAAVLAIMAASALIALAPFPAPVYAAQLVQGAAAAVLTPAIAALTLALARQEKLGERLGRNVRFAAIGSSAAAALMGMVGAWLSHRAIFWLAAACAPASLLAVAHIRASDLAAAAHRVAHPSGKHPRHRPPPPTIRKVASDPRLMIFAACMMLFSHGNAALLPTAAAALTRGIRPWQEIVLPALWGLPALHLRTTELLVAAWIVVPQLLAAAISPWLGRTAHLHGRRPVLLVGFAVLPLRALLFALDGGPLLNVAYQALDGISAAALGTMVPLVVADITHSKGRFNLAMGIVGLTVGIGGALSTAIAGMLSDRIGEAGTFAMLGAVSLLGCLVLARAMPETHPARAG